MKIRRQCVGLIAMIVLVMSLKQKPVVEKDTEINTNIFSTVRKKKTLVFSLEEKHGEGAVTPLRSDRFVFVSLSPQVTVGK